VSYSTGTTGDGTKTETWTALHTGKEDPAVKPIFDSLKNRAFDYQQLTKAPNGLGTTFPRLWFFGSCLLP
jgi:hypothetical protein